jgi:hypothetical protein
MDIINPNVILLANNLLSATRDDVSVVGCDAECVQRQSVTLDMPVFVFAALWYRFGFSANFSLDKLATPLILAPFVTVANTKTGSNKGSEKHMTLSQEPRSPS